MGEIINIENFVKRNKKINNDEDFIDFCNKVFDEQHIISGNAFYILMFMQRCIIEYLIQVMWTTQPEESFKMFIEDFRKYINNELDIWIEKKR